MFASPSFDASPAASAAAASAANNDHGPSDEDDDDDMIVPGETPAAAATARRSSPLLFSTDDDDEEVQESEEEVQEDEDEDEEDDDEEDEDDDDDAPDAATTPASATTTTTTTPATGAAAAASATTPAITSTNLTIRAVPELKLGPTYREIGKEALCWQLSSAKPGNGVEQIRDGSVDTYWQSDGLKQPHWIQVHFARRVALSHVCLYLDYSLDESYTPKRVSVHHGMTSQDLQAAVYPARTEIEFQEPNGWCVIPLSAPPDPLDVTTDTNNANSSSNHSNSNLIRAHLLRISILSMHQNGRDTHIRQVELYGPRRGEGPAIPMEVDPAAADQDDDEDDEEDWHRMPPLSSTTLGGVIR